MSTAQSPLLRPKMTPRRPTYPLSRSSRQKPRRWPLVLRFYKGAVHGQILAPVLFHSLFTVLVVYLDMYVVTSLGLPSTMIPSLSIVVGLMLVFRNQTSYDRFWTGRNCFTTCGTTVRNLSRSFLVSARGKDGKELGDVEKQDTERTVKMLVASLYAIKHCLREEWNLTPSDALAERLRSPPSSQMRRSDSGFWGSLSQSLTHSITSRPPSRAPGPLSGFATPTTPHFPTYETILSEYSGLLPPNMESFEDQGLALPLQLATSVEGFVRRGFERGWFHGPQASQMTVQLNTLTEGYGKMETIRTTPLPVAHLIHQKQVLAIYVSLLPFTTVDEFGWWSVPIVAFVAFTLYGIEGIGSQLEDPFGYDKNDIKMDAICEDTRQEVLTMVEEWKHGGRMFA